jgi:hypothetical protein
MKGLIHMYMHALHEVKENFWDYIELIDAEPHKDHRAVWYAIAADELQHFAKIKDVAWANMEGHTEMEKAFHDTMHEEYEKMKKCLEKRR